MVRVCSVPPDPGTTVPDVGTLAPHGLYSCPRWLQLLERGGRIPTRYLTCADDGHPAGLLPFHLTAPTANPAYAPAHLTRGLPVLLEPADLSYAGPISAYQCEIPTVAGVDAAAASTTLVRLVHAAGTAAGRSLAVPYLTAAAAAHLSPDLQAWLLLEDFECWFTSPAQGLDEYLDGLPRHRRQNVNRDRRLFLRAGLTQAVEPLRDCVAGLARLVGRNSAKYGQSDDERALIRHIATIAAVFGDDAVVFTARTASGDLVGAALGIFHLDALHLRMVGFDERATAGASAYFQLVYYAPLEYRVHRPHTRVHHGPKLLLTKHRHGAQLTPLWTLLLDPRPTTEDVRRANLERFATLSAGLPTELTAQLLARVFFTRPEAAPHAG